VGLPHKPAEGMAQAVPLPANPRRRRCWHMKCIQRIPDNEARLPRYWPHTGRTDNTVNTIPDFDRQALRQSDTNSLLRMYDQVKAAAVTSASRHQRDRAARAVECIAAELEKRKAAV